VTVIAPAKDAPRPDLLLGTGLLVLVFWAVHLSMLTLLANMRGVDEADHALRRLALASVGALLCFGIYGSLVRLRSRHFATQALVAASASAGAATAYAVLHTCVMYELAPLGEVSSRMTSFASLVVYWYWFYFSWTAAYLALSYSFAVRDQERRAAALRVEAHLAQMRALRYQINPHFLFNTLNSIATLVEEDPRQAERMVLNLASFFRTGLAVDPLENLPLAKEIALQRLYLEIEQVRFPNRLRFEINVPPELLEAKVPSLLLQPLVENAIKHGVARSVGVTTIRIEASTRGSRLWVQVSNDGRPHGESERADSTGIGLENVRNRLAACFGADFAVVAGPTQPSGYRTMLELPLRF
jgi:sensor histidine kinase YesM